MSNFASRSGGLSPRNVVAGRDYHPLAVGDGSHASSFPAGSVVVPVGLGVTPGRATTDSLAAVAGLTAATAVVGERVVVQTHGVLTLTEAQWDAVVEGGSGGLLPGRLYFLSAALPTGRLTAISPAVSGQWIAQVGLALSSADLLIRICLAQQIP
jgi:hypothetical protein